MTKYDKNMTKIRGTLHEDFCKFLIISSLILLRMKNVTDISCAENQSSNFVFKKLSQKILVFMK